nr:reverse transcriptase domain-containing protein [Tanacetum cinerariifolium]
MIKFYYLCTDLIDFKDMAPLPPRDQRYLWLRYQVEGKTEKIVHNFEQRLETIFERQVNPVHTLDFEGLTLDVRQDLAERLRMVYTGDDGLHTTEEMAEVRFGAYWLGSERVIPDKGDLSDYRVEISSGRDFLRGTPSYTYIRDLVRRLCHRAANVSYLLAQYLFRHAEGRKSGARLSEGHFIRRLAHHFGLVSDDRFRGLSVVIRKIPLIDIRYDVYVPALTKGHEGNKIIRRIQRRPIRRIQVIEDEPSSLFDFKEVMSISHNNQGSPPAGPPPPNNNGPPPVVRPNGPAPRSIEELCQPSIHGRGGPIAPIPIQDTDFGLLTQHMKQNGISDDALRLSLFPYSLTHHATAWYDRLPRNFIHTFDDMMRKFLSKYFPPSMVTKLRNEITKFRQDPNESLFEAWERYKLSIDRCPSHNMLLVTQIDTFYNDLTLRQRDTINAEAGGTFMQKTPE